MSTINQTEIKKFEAIAEEWWSEEGAFKPLHKFNPARIAYIRNAITHHLNHAHHTPALSGLKILDIGCGGGLIAEPLTRLGAKVTGIDASEKNIQIASLHAERMGLKIDYQKITAEELAQKEERFDAVLALEIIEHVDNAEAFIEAATSLVKPCGIIFIATLNRTPASFLKAIIGAEYVLRWLPRGTHEWKRFLKPSEIAESLRANGFSLRDVKGFSYNLFRKNWHESNDLSVNYILLASRS